MCSTMTARRLVCRMMRRCFWCCVGYDSTLLLGSMWGTVPLSSRNIHIFSSLFFLSMSLNRVPPWGGPTFPRFWRRRSNTIPRRCCRMGLPRPEVGLREAERCMRNIVKFRFLPTNRVKSGTSKSWNMDLGVQSTLLAAKGSDFFRYFIFIASCELHNFWTVKDIIYYFVSQ